MRIQTEWNVPAQIEFAIDSSSKVLESLSLISFAALFVKVMARTCQGGVGSVMNFGRISEISSGESFAAASRAETDSSVSSTPSLS
jgi:hypothetical protein